LASRMVFAIAQRNAGEVIGGVSGGVAESGVLWQGVQGNGLRCLDLP
jgi:hypothetical protein